jgi:hypothetical protein
VLFPWQFPVYGFVAFWVLFQLVALVVLGNRVDATFTVDAEGMTVAAGERIRKVNRIVTIIALLSGRPGPVGSAMLATSREDTLVRWESVSRIKFYPRQRVIQVRDSGMRTTRLFCPSDRYEEIVRRVHEETERAHAVHPTAPFPWHSLVRRLAFNLLAAVAFVLGMAWSPDETGGMLLTAAITVALAEWFDTWWLGRVLAVVALGAAALSAAIVASLAFETTTFYGIVTIHGYDRDESLLAITSLGIGLLVVMSLRRMFVRGQPQTDPTTA